MPEHVTSFFQIVESLRFVMSVRHNGFWQEGRCRGSLRGRFVFGSVRLMELDGLVPPTIRDTWWELPGIELTIHAPLRTSAFPRFALPLKPPSRYCDGSKGKTRTWWISLTTQSMASMRKRLRRWRWLQRASITGMSACWFGRVTSFVWFRRRVYEEL